MISCVGQALDRVPYLTWHVTLLGIDHVIMLGTVITLAPSFGHLTSNKVIFRSSDPASRLQQKITKMVRLAILLGYKGRGFTPSGVSTMMTAISMGGN
jgi:hypothetical protein